MREVAVDRRFPLLNPLVVVLGREARDERVVPLGDRGQVRHVHRARVSGSCVRRLRPSTKGPVGVAPGARGLMARVDPADESTFTNRNGVEAMIHGGRPMPGYLFVDPAAYESDADLTFWVEKCLEFNPKAKASGKKKSAK